LLVESAIEWRKFSTVFIEIVKSIFALFRNYGAKVTIIFEMKE